MFVHMRTNPEIWVSVDKYCAVVMVTMSVYSITGSVLQHFHLNLLHLFYSTTFICPSYCYYIYIYSYSYFFEIKILRWCDSATSSGREYLTSHLQGTRRTRACLQPKSLSNCVIQILSPWFMKIFMSGDELFVLFLNRFITGTFKR